MRTLNCWSETPRMTNMSNWGYSLIRCSKLWKCPLIMSSQTTTQTPSINGTYPNTYLALYRTSFRRALELSSWLLGMTSKSFFTSSTISGSFTTLSLQVPLTLTMWTLKKHSCYISSTSTNSGDRLNSNLLNCLHHSSTTGRCGPEPKSFRF